MLRLLHVSRFLSSHEGLTLIEKRGVGGRNIPAASRGSLLPPPQCRPTRQERQEKRREIRSAIRETEGEQDSGSTTFWLNVFCCAVVSLHLTPRRVCIQVTLLYHCTTVLLRGGAQEQGAVESGNGDWGFVSKVSRA